MLLTRRLLDSLIPYQHAINVDTIGIHGRSGFIELSPGCGGSAPALLADILVALKISLTGKTIVVVHNIASLGLINDSHCSKLI